MWYPEEDPMDFLFKFLSATLHISDCQGHSMMFGHLLKKKHQAPHWPGHLPDIVGDSMRFPSQWTPFCFHTACGRRFNRSPS